MRAAPFVKAGLCLALVFVTFFMGCCTPFGDTFRAKATRTEELRAPLADIRTLDVSTNVGSVTLEAAEVAEVRIIAEITVKAKTEEEAEELVEQVEITAEPSGERLVIEAVKPPGFGRNQLGVDYTITAPAHLALDTTTNVGDITVTGLTGEIEARTDVGSITCTDLRSDVDLRTNVGEIRVVYAVDAPAALRAGLTTNVGDIDFAGPDQISASLAAEVNVGSIDTDRPLTVTGPIKKSIQATLGEAEGRIKLHTNVGSIWIR